MRQPKEKLNENKFIEKADFPKDKDVNYKKLALIAQQIYTKILKYIALKMILNKKILSCPQLQNIVIPICFHTNKLTCPEKRIPHKSFSFS